MGKIGPISHHDNSKSHMTGLFDKCLRNIFCDDDATISEVELLVFCILMRHIKTEQWWEHVLNIPCKIQ